MVYVDFVAAMVDMAVIIRLTDAVHVKAPDGAAPVTALGVSIATLALANCANKIQPFSANETDGTYLNDN